MFLRCVQAVWILPWSVFHLLPTPFLPEFSKLLRTIKHRDRTCGNIYLAVDISFFSRRESLEIAQRKWVEAHLVPHQGVQDLFCGLYTQLGVVLRPLHPRLQQQNFDRRGQRTRLIYFFIASCPVTPAARCLIASRSSRPLFTLALKDRLRLKAPVISPPPTT